MSKKIYKYVIVDYCTLHLNKLLRKCFLWLLNKQHDQLLFSELLFIYQSSYFIIKILLKSIFHSIDLNQPPVHSTSWKYPTSWKSFVKVDEIWNHHFWKRLKFKKGQTEQTNTCSKCTIEALKEGGKYVQN